MTEVNKQDERISGTKKHLPFCDEKVAKGEIESFVLMGELSLDGTLQPVKGVLPIALRAREEGFKGVIVPLKNAREAAVVGGLDVYGMQNLGDVFDFFNGSRKFNPVKVDLLEIFACEANKYDDVRIILQYLPAQGRARYGYHEFALNVLS